MKYTLATPVNVGGFDNPLQIDSFEVPTNPKTTFNVGRVGGGTSVNAIPFEAWMEVDMRSSDKASLEALNNKFKAAMKEAVDEENTRWPNRGKVTMSPLGENTPSRPSAALTRCTLPPSTGTVYISMLGGKLVLRLE